MIHQNGDHIVFVCYETDPKTGYSPVKFVLEALEDAELFMTNRADNVMRQVEAFVVQSIGSSMLREVPEDTAKEVERINEL